jgi:UDP-GlcNAc:undecaprenyl-phosphate GlcNAc-1-phosphate transferase
MFGYGLIIFITAFITWSMTFLVRRYAYKYRVLNLPKKDKDSHKRATPLWGGIAMVAGCFGGFLTAFLLPQFRNVMHNNLEPIGILLALVIIAIVGARDDYKPMSPPAKVMGQVIAGGVLSVTGISIIYFRVPFFSIEYITLSPDWAPLITVLIVVFMANAVNLIDGLDGLASGIVAIGSLSLLIYSDKLYDSGILPAGNIGPLCAALAIGATVGFLPHNWSPAKIFMGDAGSLTLGLLMAVSIITIGGRTSESFSGQTFFFFAPLVIPVIVMGVPIADTLYAIFRRIKRKQSFSQPDKEHFHHRLVQLGHGPRRSVIILWLFTALLSAVVLIPIYTGGGSGLILVALSAVGLLFYVYFAKEARDLRIEERAKRLEKEAEVTDVQ